MTINKESDVFATTFIVESNLIENIDISQESISTQLINGVNYGHAGALLYIDLLARNKTFLQKQDICLCQKLIIDEQNDLGTHEFIEANYVGFYRPLGVNVFVGGRMGVASEKIDKTMNTLLIDIKRFLREYGAQSPWSEQQTQDIVRQIARFHFRFEQIHPFVDGNGRTGRLLTWYLFRYFGFKPFVFTEHDKRYTYYRCFDEAKDMEEYFLHRYKK